MVGKGGSTGHSGFSMPADACEEARREWSEVEEGVGQVGLPSTDAEG